MQFTAYTVVYGFAASVRNTRDPDLPSKKITVIYLDTMEGKKQERENKINVIAIANITTAFTSE